MRISYSFALVVLFCLLLTACGTPATASPTAPNEAMTTSPQLAPSSAPANTQAPPTVTLMPVPPTSTIEPTAGLAQPVLLEPCTLLTAAEAEAILGEPAGPPQEMTGVCAFSNASDSLYLVSVGVAQGAEADGLLQGLAFLVKMAGGALDDAAMAEVQSLAANRDYVGFFDRLVAAAQGVASLEAQSLEGASDAGYWVWIDAGERRQGTLAVARGDTIVNVNLIVDAGRDGETMRQVALSLAETVFSRLPPTFTLGQPPAAAATESSTPPAEQPSTATPTLIPPAAQAPTATPTLIPPAAQPSTATPTLVPPAAQAPTTVPDPNAPPAGFLEQPSYAGDCTARPAGSICLGFDDKYIWFLSPFNDSVLGRSDAGAWQGKQIQVIVGQNHEYHHILGTSLVRLVDK